MALLQKLMNHTTGPGLAAQVLVHSVQHVVQNSAPVDSLAEPTADWVVVFYLPCLGVDFLCNLTGDGGVAYTCSSCGGQGLTAALESISGTQKSHTARQGDTRMNECGHNSPTAQLASASEYSTTTTAC